MTTDYIQLLLLYIYLSMLTGFPFSAQRCSKQTSWTKLTAVAERRAACSRRGSASANRMKGILLPAYHHSIKQGSLPLYAHGHFFCELYHFVASARMRIDWPVASTWRCRRRTLMSRAEIAQLLPGEMKSRIRGIPIR